MDEKLEIKSGKIPFEYYTLSWNGFSGEPYQIRKKPLNYVFIDSSENKTASPSNAILICFISLLGSIGKSV